MEYRIALETDSNGTILATVPDLPGTQSFGDDEASALEHVKDAIVSMLEFLIRDRQPIPLPRPGAGRRVRVPALLAAKAYLHNEMLAQNVTKAELGRRLRQHMPQIDRLVDVRHASRLDQLEAAFEALGKQLEFTIAMPARRVRKKKTGTEWSRTRPAKRPRQTFAAPIHRRAR